MITEKRKAKTRKVEKRDWQQLVTDNLPLVKYVLGKMSRNLPRSVDREDLLAAGSLGLTEAARRYDPSRNVPFHSYAIPRIWGAMLDELRSHDWLSSDAREKVTRVRKNTDRFVQEHGRPPSLEEVAGALGFSVERTSQLMRLAYAEHQSTDSGESGTDVGEGDRRSRLGIAAPRGPFEEVAFGDQKRALAELIQQLPERERTVIVLRYHEDLMLHEIGKIMGVTESRVCQIHTQAVKRLRAIMLEKGLTTA
jgi:RNA polymerase sigma factor for flagellar operon FliA